MYAETKELEENALAKLPQKLRELTIKHSRCPLSVYGLYVSSGFRIAYHYALTGEITRLQVK